MKRLQRFQALFLFFTVKLPCPENRNCRKNGRNPSAKNFKFLVGHGIDKHEKGWYSPEFDSKTAKNPLDRLE